MNRRLLPHLLVLTLLILPGCRHQPVGSVVPSFRFVQMCDPQLGFDNYAADLKRLEQAADKINALRPDLVVFCCDLVNAADDKSLADFQKARARFAVPTYVAAGNHDVGNSPTPESLERYRRVFGRDYYATEHKGVVFVVLNAQLWKTPLPKETAQQDGWLARTLKKAAKRQRPVFVVMHYPLFLKTPDEPDEYFNLPREKRKELLLLFERSEVVAVLAGHTHTTTSTNYRGIQMVTSQSTSRNFDKQPHGFRLWHVDANRPYRHEFVPLTGDN